VVPGEKEPFFLFFVGPFPGMLDNFFESELRRNRGQPEGTDWSCYEGFVKIPSPPFLSPPPPNWEGKHVNSCALEESVSLMAKSSDKIDCEARFCTARLEPTKCSADAEDCTESTKTLVRRSFLLKQAL